MFVDPISVLAARFCAGELTDSEYMSLVEDECAKRFPPPSTAPANG